MSNMGLAASREASRRRHAGVSFCTASAMRLLALFLVLIVAAAVPEIAFASGIDSQYPVVRSYFPTATQFGALSGTPPAAPVYTGKKIIGYVFETTMVAPVPAYSGEPVNVLVAIDPTGKIVGTKVLEQNEPILLVGIPVQRLYDFVARYIGHRVTDNIVVGGGGGADSVPIDAISSATVTSMAVNQTIMDSAVKIAVSRGIVAASAVEGVGGAAQVRMSYYKKADWQQLRGNGAIRRLHLTRGEVTKAFKGMPPPLFPSETSTPPPGHDNDTFTDLYYTLVTPPTVGRNLLGESGYANLLKHLKPGDQAIAIMANGMYSFKGLGYVRGGIFDRVHVMQGRNMVLFHDFDYIQLIDAHLAGMPAFSEMAIFIISKSFGFDPGRPWTLQLLVRRQVGPLQTVYTTFNGTYQTPEAYLERPARPLIAANAPLWQRAWRAEAGRIVILLAALTVLTGIFFFQDTLVRRPALYHRLRISFLIFTLVWLGWYADAQLSVVNIFAFFNSLRTNFRWETFLVDPLTFILWCAVAAGMLFWGRGAFCGWLCPFGALQELLNAAAKRLHIPQFPVPFGLHQRLWPIKYIVFLTLFGISLYSLSLSEKAAEVEPFKTAIILRFMREWPFVLYAGALLAVNLSVERFFCRYLCPLGGALAIPARMRMFDWLRRYRECGNPCQRCAHECPVQAIHPEGNINPNECIQCLHCQELYHDDHRCPVMIQRRLKSERRAAVIGGPPPLSGRLAVAKPVREGADQRVAPTGHPG